MNPTEFANKIRAKYPGAYDNVADDVLTQKVVAKYPVYASQVKMPETGAIQNTKHDVGRGGSVETENKISNFLGVKKLGEGIGQTISNTMGGQREVLESQDSLIGTQGQLVERIKKAKSERRDTTRLESALKNIDDEISTIGKEATNLGTGGLTNKEVLGSALKTATTIAGAGANSASSLLGKTAQFGTTAAAGGAADALIENKDAGGIAKDAAVQGAIGAGTGLVFGLAEKGFKALGNFLGKTGDKIQTSVIKPSQADIKDGFSIDTVKKYNLGGSLKQTFEKTDSKLDELSKQLSEKIGSSNASIDLNKIYENTTKRLLGNKFESFGSNKAMENAIENLRTEILGVAGKNGMSSLPESQLIKRAAGHFGAWTFGVPTPEATASQKVYNMFYNELKTAIEEASPEGVKGLNQEISKLIPVMNALIRRIPVAERNNALSLTDIISLTGAALEPRALSISLLNLASKSGRVGSFLSNNAAKAGNAIAKGIGALEPAARVGVSR